MQERPRADVKVNLGTRETLHLFNPQLIQRFHRAGGLTNGRPEGGEIMQADQVIGGLAIAAFVIVASGLLFGALRGAGVLRVSEEEEYLGLDVSIHGEAVYASDHGGAVDLTNTEAKV